MRTAVVLVMTATLVCGCHDAGLKAIESKCDAPLRQTADRMARDGDSGPIEILGKAAGPIDDSRRRKLADAGADLGQVMDELFTARVPAHRLGNVARLDFVKSLQLSQERGSLKP